MISIAGSGVLMNSRCHSSEDALAEQACAQLADCSCARVLIGGLGMGFTLAATLRCVGRAATVEVAELVAEVVSWNHGPLAAAAGYPLRDPRVTVQVGDVAARIQSAKQYYDAILLDVDNGPQGLTCAANDGLYGQAGLAGAYVALRSGGVLAVWSAADDDRFTRRLHKAGFRVRQQQVRAHERRGEQHTLWFAQRP